MVKISKSIVNKQIIFKKLFYRKIIYLYIYLKFQNYLMIKGKKNVTLKILNKCFFFIKHFIKKNPLFVLNKILGIISPLIVLKKWRIGRKNFFISKKLNYLKSLETGLRYIVSCSRKRKKKIKIEKKLFLEIMNVYLLDKYRLYKSLTLKHKKNLSKNILINKQNFKN